MYQFSVSPSDQRLFLKGVELEGADKTLAELSVVPNSIIVLRVSSLINLVSGCTFRGTYPRAMCV